MQSNYFPFQEACFYWKIKNVHLSIHSHGKQPITSPKFSFDSAGIVKFFLCLYPKGDPEFLNDKFASIYLVRDASDSGPKHVFIHFKLTLCDNRQVSTKLCHTFNARFDKGSSYGATNFVKRATLLKCERNVMQDKQKGFFIKCELSLEDDTGETYSPWTCDYKDLECLSSNLTTALTVSDDWDLQLKCSDGALFRGHKAIIVNRFPSLFESFCSQRSKTELSLDVSASTLHSLLKYLYSGKLEKEVKTKTLFKNLDVSKLPHLQSLVFPLHSSQIAFSCVFVNNGSFAWILPTLNSLWENTTLTKTFYCDESLDWTKIIITLRIRKNCSNEDCVSFSAQVMSTPDEPVYLECRVQLLDIDEKHKHYFQNETIWDMPLLIEVDDFKDMASVFLKDDKKIQIFFKFKISVVKSTEVKSFKSSTVEEFFEGNVPYKSQYSNLWALQGDLKRLYKNPLYSDVIICAGERKLPAHKFVLSARSSKFSDVMKQNKLQQQPSYFIIEGLEEETVNIFLSYLYCGELTEYPDDVILAFDLYRAADKFGVHCLRRKCIEYFNRKLDAENFGWLLMLANKYNEKSLEEIVTNYVYFNVDEISKSTLWKDMITENSDVFAVMRKIQQCKDVEIVRIMLLELYRGKFYTHQADVDAVIKLYLKVNEYEILKTEYIEVFKQVIGPESIGKILELAEELNDADLQKCVWDFVYDNVDRITNSDEWKRIRSERKDLADDMQTIASSAKNL